MSTPQHDNPSAAQERPAGYTLSLVVPCYNEAKTIEACVDRILAFAQQNALSVEIVAVDDASTDGCWDILQKIAQNHPRQIKILRHEKNRGKGAALRTGFTHATGGFVGIQDADAEYDPGDYLAMLEPMLDGRRADVVYGSRYLRPNTRCVHHFWHSVMNRALTAVSNAFTDLDISDMETCYKLFRRETIQKIAPLLKEERFGFEPEITARVAEAGCRVYECAISYSPRGYEEGKKIGWRDGMHALYCVFHYGAHNAPLPIMVLIYLFIGALSLAVNNACFVIATQSGVPLNPAIIAAAAASAACNYLLCVAILFRHKSRWSAGTEIFWYALSVSLMGLIDYSVTHALIAAVPFFNAHWSGAKLIASGIGFIGNFAFRKWLVFPKKKNTQPPLLT
ncbi:MAG: bifunctional glycosyltransferase family 2/GtrA family protein [Chitinispirillia bacterium]|nr:bifunctional glycosyltransferase family 2/GtrA family protein [Chitinispirillia bacterium]MCL2241691.1 bifunctional glycosyltransferase family 2/GtrA family protein [Chitinispirillia bacterium]